VSLGLAGLERRVAADRKRYDRLLAKVRDRADRASSHVLNAYMVALDAMNNSPPTDEETNRITQLVGKVRQAHELMLEVAQLAKDGTP